jgi:hypothetical protein
MPASSALRPKRTADIGLPQSISTMQRTVSAQVRKRLLAASNDVSIAVSACSLASDSRPTARLLIAATTSMAAERCSWPVAWDTASARLMCRSASSKRPMQYSAHPRKQIDCSWGAQSESESRSAISAAFEECSRALSTRPSPYSARASAAPAPASRIGEVSCTSEVFWAQ